MRRRESIGRHEHDRNLIFLNDILIGFLMRFSIGLMNNMIMNNNNNKYINIFF